MRKFLLILAVVLVAAIGYILLAQHRQYNSAGGLAVAERTWGDVCGVMEPNVKVVDLPLPRQAGESDAAWIELPGGGRQYTKCDIKIDRKAVAAVPGVSTNRAMCATLVHEYGHLAGKEHVNDPNAIMYFKLTSRNIPNDC